MSPNAHARAIFSTHHCTMTSSVPSAPSGISCHRAARSTRLLAEVGVAHRR